MSSTETTEGKELSLISKVELRIALTDSDVKLESILKTYLAPLLLKLSSPHVSVRNKVISVCQHINTRIKPPSVKLPVGALLKQYKDTHNPLVRGFDLLYVQQSIDRISIQDRLDLLPIVIHGLADNLQESAAHTATLFNLLLKLLHHMKLPARGSNDDVDLRVKFSLDDNQQDAKFIASWLGKLILLTISGSEAKSSPGLSLEDSGFLQLYGKSNVWTTSSSDSLNLTETKIAAAKFLSSGAFIDSERFMPALFASADPNSRISSIGDDILKRATSVVSFEDHGLVADLLTIYLGTRGPSGSLPARAPLQTKILAILCRSKEATTFATQIIQIVKEGLALDRQGQGTNSGQQNQGLEAAKLRAQVFQFTNWVSRIGSHDSLSTVAPSLVYEIRLYIESQGWPQFSNNDTRATTTELSSRSYGYESIGLLAKSCPRALLLDPDLDLLRWLFSSLSGDTSGKEISISIEQALASVLGAFGGDIGSDIEASLKDLLLHQMDLRIGDTDSSENTVMRGTQYTAVRFANRCLPFNNTDARWIDVLALGLESTGRSEVLDEGQKGLDPYWYRNMNPLQDVNIPTQHCAVSAPQYALPTFEATVKRFFNISDDKIRSDWRQLSSGLSAAVAFCRCLILHQALATRYKAPLIDADWKKNIDAVVRNDEIARKEVRLYLDETHGLLVHSSAVLTTYLHNAFVGLLEQPHGTASDVGDCLLELCSICPASVLDALAFRAIALKKVIFSGEHAMRLTGSHVFGLLASRSIRPKEDIEDLLNLFHTKLKRWEEAIGSDVHQVHGSILALAYWLSRKTHHHQGIDVMVDLKKEFISTILSILISGRDRELLAAAIYAINQLCLFNVLSPQSIPESRKVSDVITRLIERAKTGDEKSVSALGYLAMQCEEDNSNDSTLNKVLDKLYGLHEIRQAELQFAVGAALSCAGCGWESKSLVEAVDFSGSLPQTSPRSSTLKAVLEKVLEDCKTTKPALRQASVIWLLCLVQYCGHLKGVSGELRACQVAFKGFLSDRDSLNQESASRGLTLVYEKGDKALKDDLVRDLVGSFIGSSAGLAGNVSEETQLFEPGALPTGEGSVTTYKDIMSLASEVGDSSLVYRFMSLASNNAIWSSRAAFGRFGLSNILSDSSVDGYLARNPKLYPALYRYRFDPNTNVRTSMNDIWSALVKDSAATIDSSFDLIMNDLLKNILGKEWRVRQASCGAIADLVQGRPLQRYEKYLTQIWTLTFKVCDDIKESVRASAMSLARVLTGVLTRSLEAGDSSATSANTMLKEVLPFLLSPSGLESSAQEVQAFALKTLLQIIKSSNKKTLGPFIPDLLSRLIGLLSSLEPQAINYIHLNADKYGMTPQQIDDVRLSSVKSSPMMEAIERCLDMLDEDSMKILREKLGNAIKTAVGLPSRVGCTRVVVSLSTRHNAVFRPHADYFLQLCQRQMLDRNDTISTSFAVACGYLGRLISDDMLLRIIIYCRKLYFDSEDDRHRTVSGEITHALANYATDRFTSVAVEVLPFVFIAKHDTHERTKELFTNTWSENVGGSRAVMLYLKEIIAMALPYLDSPSWSIKHTSAFAIADIVAALGSEISSPNAEVLWPALEKAIAGKTWDGKEKILEAVVKFAKHSNILSASAQIAGQMQMIMLREGKRNNHDYRPHALACLGDFIELRGEVDWYNQIHSITEPIIAGALDNVNEMDVDSRSGGLSSKLVSEQTLANALKTLFRSINPTILSPEDLAVSLSQTLSLARKAISKKSRTVLEAAFDGEKILFQKLHDDGSTSKATEDILLEHVPVLFDQEDRVEQTRVKAIDAAAVLASYKQQGSRLKTLLEREINSAREHERAYSVKQSLDRAKSLL